MDTGNDNCAGPEESNDDHCEAVYCAERDTVNFTSHSLSIQVLLRKIKEIFVVVFNHLGFLPSNG